jgi:hypothetical protein
LRWKEIVRTLRDLKVEQAAGVGQALGLCVGLVESGYQLQLGVAESLKAGLELGLRVERASV